MPGAEGYRPFQPQRVRIPIENVGVRGSGRRPGERRLNLVRAAEPEQPKTLLAEMQQYITTRQSLRDNGYFFLMGKEQAKINLADATHNDLDAIGLDERLRDWDSVFTKGNHVRMMSVYDSYAIGSMSPEKQQEVLELWEDIRKISIEKGHQHILPITHLIPAETETVTWLLARIKVPLDAPPEGFSESEASLLFRMRKAVASKQPQWEQEKKAPEERHRASRRG